MTYDLIEQYLVQAEEILGSDGEQDSLLEALEHAEKLSDEEVSVLCRSARVLFRYGILHSKGRFLLLALDKLSLAAAKDLQYFEDCYVWWQLWGNILVQLGKLVDDSSMLEVALEKYEKAAAASGEIDSELYWDWGEAWILLGQRSGEVTDIKQGIAKFRVAEGGGIHSSFFRLDYGSALMVLGHFLGDPSIVEEAMAQFRLVINDTFSEPPSIVYLAAWRKIALASKLRYQLSHLNVHLDEADRIMRDAILSGPKNGELWLDWGELFLYAGWISRDAKLVEMGLEKLTATKVKECEPLRVTSLLGTCLLMLGLLHENLKLIKEGEERIREALELAPDHKFLLFAEGFSQMALGLYFSDTTALAKAVARFDEVKNTIPLKADCEYALFQTYLSWGVFQADFSLTERGIQAIRRLCELRPFSAVHRNEWGVALLRLRHLEIDAQLAEEHIREAITHFENAWELSKEPEALYNWGCAYDLLGDLTGDEEDYGEGVDLLSRAVDKMPSKLHPRYHLGLTLAHLGELVGNADCLAQAVELLESVAKIETEDDTVWNELGYALLNLAELTQDALFPQESENRLREAEKALVHAAELGSGDALYHLACLYALTGFPERCLQYLHKAAAQECLPPLEELEHDNWLDKVREMDEFINFLEALRGDHG